MARKTGIDYASSNNNASKPENDSHTRILKYTLIIGIAWTVILAWLLTLSLFGQRQESQESALVQARHSFEKDLVYRRWAAVHGGVYVPITDETPPNPYLSHIENRDITTTSGLELTLMNPAYMTRQVHELGLEQYGFRGHITSLNPIRPENKADAWETEALQAFERGETEVFSTENINGESYMRMMRVMITEQQCLKCHEKQGYKVGDIRGGISVSVPMVPLWTIANKHSRTIATSYILVWLIGLGGIGIGNRIIKKRLHERKLAVQDLRELSLRNDAILAAVPDIIMEVDYNKIYTWSNRAGYEFFGEDVLGKEAAHYFEGEQNTYDKAQPLCSGSENIIYIESWQRRKDGKERLLAWTCKSLRDKDGNVIGALSSARDITDQHREKEDRKKLEVHMRQHQKLESIGTLAGGVAHEINNPINGIMNYAQLISDRLDEKNPLRRYATEIIQETERTATIVRNLLTFSRAGKETHNPARIKDIVDGTVSLVQTIIRHDQITLEIDVPGDLPIIRCRSQQIQQVLMNLLTNARDALNERYPEFDEDKILIVKVRPFERDEIDWIRMTVEDHGIGIPDEVQDRIFDPFFTTKDRTKGTGLGLSISYGIIEDHHGEMFVESEPGQYTRFHVDLRVNNGWTIEE
ncbi:MAG: DUF3365 domain-containing protein [Candidatus Electryonea clarkiae]|nr:DUF3365 domain-containing protein [Candidatus Electryonea clarkiae]MDP8286235.1 DUF3365 domain-containing protein [Candidatus Electryonea clarkiae]